MYCIIVIHIDIFTLFTNTCASVSNCRINSNCLRVRLAREIWITSSSGLKTKCTWNICYSEYCLDRYSRARVPISNSWKRRSRTIGRNYYIRIARGYTIYTRKPCTRNLTIVNRIKLMWRFNIYKYDTVFHGKLEKHKVV